MIDFYTAATPNGRTIAIMLEEARLDYAVHLVDLTRGGQFDAAFAQISPNNTIPAIVDRSAPGGPLSMFESGAILVYLAGVSGVMLPADARARSVCLQWLFWQVSGLGPMLGQFNWYRIKDGPGFDQLRARFAEEGARLLAVMDRRLAEREFLGGACSIADIAAYPWAIDARQFIEAATGARFAHIGRWEKAMEMRPAVGRGMAVGASMQPAPT
jgi:GST-like protein